jgi:hypothetical protein
LIGPSLGLCGGRGLTGGAGLWGGCLTGTKFIVQVLIVL